MSLLLCLLDIGGVPYICHKIMAQKPYFHIFTSSYYARKLPKPRPSELV